jgi:hypothetical protein
MDIGAVASGRAAGKVALVGADGGKSFNQDSNQAGAAAVAGRI